MSHSTDSRDHESTIPDDPFDFVRSITVRVRGVDDDIVIDPTAVGSLAGTGLEPIRQKRPHKGQPNFSGFHFHSGLRRHIWFESRLEQQFLQPTESDSTISEIVAQPFRIEWNHPELHTHIPDYLVFHTDGRVRIVNVKPAHRVAASQVLFGLVDSFARAVRVTSEVFTGASAGERESASFLHRFRLEPCRVEQQLPERFTLRWIYEQHDPALTRSVLTDLAHRRLVAADGSSRALNDDTILVAGEQS